MNMFDVIVLAVVGVSTVLGLWKGLVRQVLGLAGVVGGYVIAMKFYAPLAAKFLPRFLPVTGHVISFLAIFIACIIAASIVGWIIGRLVNTAGLGMLNRIAGGLLGGAKGCLIVAVVTMMLVAFLPPHSGVLKGSRTMRYIRPMASMISKVAPKVIKTKYDEKTAKMGRLSDERK
jgi:membrane protein required for colicin V production